MNILSAVFNLDAFHYIRARTLLAREMERLLLPQGVLLLLHVHNSLVSNDPAIDGIPLTPLNWVRLFQQIPVRAFPEKSLTTDSIQNNRLDLLKEYAEAELNADSAVRLVGTADKVLIKIYEEINDELLMHKDNLIVNPLYRIEDRTGNNTCL